MPVNCPRGVVCEKHNFKNLRPLQLAARSASCLSHLSSPFGGRPALQGEEMMRIFCERFVTFSWWLTSLSLPAVIGQRCFVLLG